VRRIVIWLASTVTVVVLLFGYHTSTNSAASTAGTSASSAPAAPSATPSAAAPPDPSSSPSSSSGSSGSSGSSSATKTYTGDTADTRWGPVQVAITVTDGKITKVEVPVSPSGNQRDLEINDQALPTLVQETLDAQSANIDMVSGATVTSDGYLTSLQSALDKAGI
jgi:uncharacterized protein with FMN-binding domain